MYFVFCLRGGCRLQLLAKDGNLYVLGTPKKCAFLEEAAKAPRDGVKVSRIFNETRHGGVFCL